MDAAEKVRENRLRRVADRQGLRLEKARRRDRRALDFGLYWLYRQASGALVSPERGITLDEIAVRLGELDG